MCGLFFCASREWRITRINKSFLTDDCKYDIILKVNNNVQAWEDRINMKVIFRNKVKKKALSVRDMALCGLFAAITAILAPISIPIGAVPITIGVFAVLLTGAVLKPGYAFLSQVVYLLIGAVGLPVFSGFSGGIQKIAGPTGGYLIIYPVMAWLAALVTQTAFKKITGKNKAALRTIGVFCGMLVSVAICYVTGTLWYSLQSGTSVMQAAAVTAVPFIPWDILKCAAASLIGVTVKATIRAAGEF